MLLNVRNTGGAISYSEKRHSCNTSSYVLEHCHSGKFSSEQNVYESKPCECDNEHLLQPTNEKLTLFKEKMCKLEKYGEPPALSSISTTVNSNLKKKFVCPVLCFKKPKTVQKDKKLI